MSSCFAAAYWTVLIQLYREESSGSEDESMDDVDSAEEEGSEDEEEAPQVRPYMALLQGFTDNSAPQAKRRKLDHSRSDAAVSKPTAAPEDESESEEDEKDIDQVDEPEEPANDLEEQPEDDSSDDEEGSSDPFDVHFAHADEAHSSTAVKTIKDENWTTRRAMVNSWRGTFMDPGPELARVPQAVSSLEDLHLKQKLKESASKKMSNLSDAEKHLMPLVFGYNDVLHCDRTIKESDALRRMVCLHALNHVFK